MPSESKPPQTDSDSSNGLDAKVEKWLHTEGYPLEFSVAHLFKQNGFAVRQGDYIKSQKTQENREIDVVAFRDCHIGTKFIRIYHIVECKWSADKPWVVFTSHKPMSPAACISQTIASELASGILWMDAGLPQLHGLSLFATPHRAGFGGRQAFSTDNNDRFYSALKTVFSLATNIVNKYDHNLAEKENEVPLNGAIAFPLIVVQGPIYEAFFDSDSGKVIVKRVDSVRCHWRGSNEREYHSTVDVVSFSALPSLLKTRSFEVETLERLLELSWATIIKARQSKQIESLSISTGSRGIVGMHPLFRKLRREQDKQRENAS